MGIIVATVCLSLQCVPSAVYVYDGDTFRIDHQWYRIANIDAPEIRGKCLRERVRAQAARVRLEGLLRNQAIKVTLVGYDKLDRKLAHITVADTDIGDALMQDGLARKWTKTWDRKSEPWCQL